VPKTAKPTANTINLGAIPTIVTAKPSKKGNPDRMMKDIADLTAIGRVIADLKDAESVVDERVNEAAWKIFLDEGCESQSRIGNFKGCETDIIDGVSVQHSVSCELRNSGSALSEEAVRLAKLHNIPIETKPITTATYILDPEYAGNMAVMQAVVDVLNAGMPKINAVIAKEGLAERVILQAQAGSSKTVTVEQTLPAVFRLPRDVAETVVRMFGVMAVGKGKFELPAGKEADLTEPLMRTAKLLGRPGFRAEMQGMAAKKKAEKSTKRAAA
jgi:hypothetical protein